MSGSEGCCGSQEQVAGGADKSGKYGVYYHFLVSDAKLRVVNIDSENYMLRGIGEKQTLASGSMSLSGGGAGTVPCYDAARTQERDNAENLDMLFLRDLATSLEATTDSDNSSYCARICSFHNLFCSCELSCCCMCGIQCSPDCHACFHKCCVKFSNNHACKKNPESLPPATLNYDKVSNIFLNLK